MEQPPQIDPELESSKDIDPSHNEQAKGLLKGVAVTMLFGGAAMFGGKAVDRLVYGIEAGDPTISISDRIEQMKTLTTNDGKERGSIFVVDEKDGALKEIQYVTGGGHQINFSLGGFNQPEVNKALMQAERIVEMHSHPLREGGAELSMPSVEDLVQYTFDDFRFEGNVEGVVLDGPRTWHIEVDEQNMYQQFLHTFRMRTTGRLPTVDQLSEDDYNIYKAYVEGADLEKIKEAFATFPQFHMDVLKEIDAELNSPEGFYCFAKMTELNTVMDGLHAKELKPEERDALVVKYQEIAQSLGYTVSYAVTPTP